MFFNTAVLALAPPLSPPAIVGVGEEAPQKGSKKIALGERQRYGSLNLGLGRIKGDLFYSLWPGLTLGLAGFPGGEKVLSFLPFVGAKLGNFFSVSNSFN